MHFWNPAAEKTFPVNVIRSAILLSRLASEATKYTRVGEVLVIFGSLFFHQNDSVGILAVVGHSEYKLNFGSLRLAGLSLPHRLTAVAFRMGYAF